VSDDFSAYVQFRARLVRQPTMIESGRLAGRELLEGTWTEFEPRELLGRRFGRARLSLVLGEDYIAVEGLRGEGNWAALSIWLRAAVVRVEIAQEITGRTRSPAYSVEDVVREMAAALAGSASGRLGAGEVVFHLEHHVPERYGIPMSRLATVGVLRQLGFDVARANVSGLARNGRARAERVGCRLCDGIAGKNKGP
jgi:hypothetical protein